MTRIIGKGTGTFLALASMAVATVAQAQIAPAPAPTADYTASLNVASTSHQPAAPQAAPTGGREYILLADYVAPCNLDGVSPENREAAMRQCDVPRAARENTLAEDTPMVSQTAFLRDHPNAGVEGWQRIVDSNTNLCEWARETWNLLQQLDTEYLGAEATYEELMLIYNDLPQAVKNATRVMTVSSAVATGALCLLTAGLYCLAAAANAVGYWAVSRASERVTLANIRISIANIKLSRLNITLSRITIRLDGRWLYFAVPACMRLVGTEGWNLGDTTTGTGFPTIVHTRQW